MDLITQLKKDYKQAMKSKNKIKKQILNYVIAQIKAKQIDSKGDELSYDDIVKVIRKEIKSRKETIGYLQKADKSDDLKIENQKVEILSEYLPKLMDKKQLTELVKSTIKANDIEDPHSSRGEIIRPIMKEYRSKVDGSLLNQIINEL